MYELYGRSSLPAESGSGTATGGGRTRGRKVGLSFPELAKISLGLTIENGSTVH